ncbi:MFS transporter [Streptomyces sp. SID8379]|uniref:MFS transporter n=1 Tax=unclassified Streptomyces TaxID=2593676 RepID=UPI00035DAE91|nr:MULTISPECIES: MFS transporter [unclassified Streptomyces]MYW63437.1 MFS transporter [Streptomyces sp. SID8379]
MALSQQLDTEAATRDPASGGVPRGSASSASAASSGGGDEPVTRFHWRVTATTFGANFSDGYALGIIGAALPVLTNTMHLSGVWQGLLGASALIGLFFGSILLGGLADRIGRQKLYVANFILITLASAAQLWAHDPATLFVLRLLIGFGLGADYAVGPTLLSEFAPRRLRGILLGSLTVMWTVGYVVANILGTFVPLSDSAAHWLLASGAIPAVLVLVLRIGTPESPSWLDTRGRHEEAARIRRDYLGQRDARPLTEKPGARPKSTARYRDLFAKGQRRNTWFGVLFYSAQVLPYFAIYTFVPSILSALSVSDADLQYVLLNLFLLAGGVLGLWPLHRVGRRPFTTWSFLLMTVCLSAMALLSGAGAWWLMVPFLLYTFIMAGASNITQVYPAELFPTPLRGSGVGLLNGSSRVASAVGTFVLPVSLTAVGVGWSMAWLAGVLALGTVGSFLWAPETKDTVTAEEMVH